MQPCVRHVTEHTRESRTFSTPLTGKQSLKMLLCMQHSLLTITRSFASFSICKNSRYALYKKLQGGGQAVSIYQPWEQ